MSSQRSPPSAGEMEVSLFGPGIGECVVVHLSGGDWLVVDSCLDDDGEPVALNYLRRMGVDPAGSIKHIVISHWHDDHHAGIAKVVKSAASAKVWCSAALKSEEFLTTAMFARNLPIGDTGVGELGLVLNELDGRRKAGARKAAVGPDFVLARSMLVDRTSPPVRVLALSPSSATCSLAVNEIAEMIPTLQPGTRRLVAQQPNDLSVVLALRLGDQSVLLGSDLEETRNEATGWTAVCDVAADLGHRSAVILKVPHHGSETAHSRRLWEEQVAPNAIGILTPFRRQKLPRDADVERLLGSLGELYATASPTGKKLSFSRPAAVERELRAVVRERWALNPQMGHVRLRFPAAGTFAPSIELFGPADRLVAPRSPIAAAP